MPTKVYFSDTSSELVELRPVLIEQIRKAAMTPIWLTDAEKQQPNMAEIVRQKIAEADCFIGIVTYKRGWEPGGMNGKSLAEIEYETARSSGKPAAILMPAPNSDMDMYLRMRAVGQSEAERSAQQTFWKQIMRGETVHTFTNETDLTQQIAQLLASWATPAEAEAAVLKPQRELNFLPVDGVTIETLADRVAEKTAQKVQEIHQQQQEELAKQTLKYNEVLRLLPGELVFGRPAARSQFQGDIFMVMPFDKRFTSIFTDIIRPLCTELKLTIARGDEFTSTSGVIIGEVWAALNNCKFVIAEITGGNDNVFYELGIAHTLNKPAILITQAKRPSDVPFDIRHQRYIQYENTVAGGAKLRDDLSAAITRLRRDLEEGWGNGV